MVTKDQKEVFLCAGLFQTEVECIFRASQGPLNLHCIRIMAASVRTPNTLIKYVHWMYTANFQCTFRVVQCMFSVLITIAAHCSVFWVSTEDCKQSTFSAALQVPWSYTEPALHFDGGGGVTKCALVTFPVHLQSISLHPHFEVLGKWI